MITVDGSTLDMSADNSAIAYLVFGHSSIRYLGRGDSSIPYLLRSNGIIIDIPTLHFAIAYLLRGNGIIHHLRRRDGSVLDVACLNQHTILSKVLYKLKQLRHNNSTL